VPDLWLVQYYLSELGYDPGGLDGLWGSRTQAAAQAFSDEWGTGQGTIDLNVAVAGSNLFGGALRNAARDAGLDMTLSAPSSGPGGSGTAPEVSDADTGPSSHTETPAGTSGGGFGGLLMPLALLGIGAVLVFSKKR
jgi:hypothetical protein